MTTNAGGCDLGQQTSGTESLDYAIHLARKLVQRGNDCLTLKNLALGKRYLKGQLLLHIHFRWNDAIKGPQYCAIFHGRESNDRASRRLPIPEGGADQAEDLMLVTEIHPVKRAQSIIPARIRFDLLDKVHSLFYSRTLWYSIKSGFESLGRVKERETRLSGRGTVAVNGEAPQDIQRTPQIVDRIGCNGAQAHGCGGILDAHRIKTAPRFPFCLDDDSVRVSLEES